MRALALIVGLLLVGCATLANTPAQERGQLAYERCRHLLPPNAYLQRIEPDGRIWILGTQGRGAFFACYQQGG